MRLPYARRLAAGGSGAPARASLAGVALALRALGELLGRSVAVSEIRFAAGDKPRLAAPPAPEAAGAGRRGAHADAGDAPACEFSIAHSGHWVACAALARGRIGLDLETGTDARIADWVVREAALKATGEGLRAAHAVRELRYGERQACWRGRRWHLRRLDLFPGASACVISSRALAAIEAHALTLAELFAP